MTTVREIDGPIPTLKISNKLVFIADAERPFPRILGSCKLYPLL